VDIPTIANWLGHSDGGALLMSTYAHLRQTHSLRMAQQVSFGIGGDWHLVSDSETRRGVVHSITSKDAAPSKTAK
jgi:hypothetical protein